MIVYRYLCEQEYKDLVGGHLEKIGGVYAGKGVSNTFNYKRNERYLHFFKNKTAIEEMKWLYRNDGKDYYTCSFDVPFLTLLKSMGKGFYKSTGYDIDYTEIREFAVPVKDFNPKFLIDAQLDEEKHLRVLAENELQMQ